MKGMGKTTWMVLLSGPLAGGTNLTGWRGRESSGTAGDDQTGSVPMTPKDPLWLPCPEATPLHKTASVYKCGPVVKSPKEPKVSVPTSPQVCPAPVAVSGLVVWSPQGALYRPLGIFTELSSALSSPCPVLLVSGKDFLKTHLLPHFPKREKRGAVI